ncbi:MAG: hypothetical protein E4G94_12085 [ANME-2 cluster archaeon]|nr:MAG: hypothetical protein E4G94_12085 [ANME-2 cluster archaeon]
MVIASINPVIRGWGNYFKGGTVKKRFEELDGFRVFGRRNVPGRSFCTRSRNPNLGECVLFHLVHYLNNPSPAMG